MAIMRYSLLSRFKGTLLGMTLGEMYASRQSPQSIEMGDRFSHLTLSCARSLLNCSNINEIPGISLEPTSDRALAIAIPIALLAHESQTKLRERLDLAIAPSLETTQSSALAIAHLISRSLSQKPETDEIIPKICQLISSETSDLIPQLEQVQSWLETKVSLEQVRRHASSYKQGVISSAMYSFLSTPSDYVLTVRRAFYLGGDRPLVCALAGALAGARNSWLGIPISWRFWIDAERELEIEQLSQHLLADWSGVYQTSVHGSIARQAIAAPQIMSSRRDRD
jgi:hypothetical protein